MAIEHFHNLKFKEKFLFDVCSGVFIIKSSLVTYSLRSNKAKFQISSEKSKTATSAVFTISHTLKKFWPRLAFFRFGRKVVPKFNFVKKRVFYLNIRAKNQIENHFGRSMDCFYASNLMQDFNQKMKIHDTKSKNLEHVLNS